MTSYVTTHPYRLLGKDQEDRVTANVGWQLPTSDRLAQHREDVRLYS